VKFGHVDFRYASGQTDRQTDTLIKMLRTHNGSIVKRTKQEPRWQTIW